MPHSSQESLNEAGQAQLGRKTLLLAWLFIVCFSLLALFYYSPNDPSPFSTAYPSSEILNKCGIIGAFLSSFLIFHLGLNAIILCFFLGAIAAQIYAVRFKAKKFLHSLSLWLSTMIFTALLCSHYNLEVMIDGIPHPLGGSTGEILLDLLLKPIGDGGLFLVCFLLFFYTVEQAVFSKIKYFKSLNLSSIFSRSFKSLKKKDQTFKKTKIETKITLPLKNKTNLKTNKPLDETKTPEIRDLSDIFKANKNLKNKGHLSQDQENTKSLIEQTLLEFNISGKVISAQPGPVVTVYNFQMSSGIKLSRIQNLVDDLALSLQVESIFIQPSPENKAMGIQVPNKHRTTVYLGDTLLSRVFKNTPSTTALALGTDIFGEPLVESLGSMPHLLIAGATGAGKSVGINTLIASLLARASPTQVRFILVDPKMLELSIYEGIPHLLMPVITEPRKAASALAWAIFEMERRYQLMKDAKVRSIDSYNSIKAHEKLPFIVIIIDELADLMLTAAKSVETSIQRLAQKARASGIHMILATQRPSVDVITGVIKANLPTRIAFQVTSKHDSRTILDQGGAEKLLGKGDMLFQRPGVQKPVRGQGAFVSDEEISQFVDRVRETYDKSYFDLSAIEWIENHKLETKSPTTPSISTNEDFDVFYDQAVEIADSKGEISASFIQRQFKIGYNRAARIVEDMTAQGLISEPDGAKPRKWLKKDLV